VFLLGALLFVAAEITAFVVVAERIGLLWALALLIVLSALGPFVVRRVGVAVIVRTQERLARGEVPTRELLDGLVVLLGGALICIPGFITDAIGLLLMIRPLRHLVIRTAGNRLVRRVQTITIPTWRVTGTRSQPKRSDPYLPLPPPDRSIESGHDDAE
jgi:UPF0716 protein FxsA